MSICQRKHLFLWICCLPTLLVGQVKFTSKLDSAEMLIGDHNSIHFEFVADTVIESLEIQFEYWDTLDQLELLKEEAIVHREGDKEHLYSKEVRFTIFDSGLYVLPPIPISWSVRDQDQRITSPSYEIRVSYPEIDESDLAPIKPIEKEPLKWQDFQTYVYGALLVILLIIFWIYFKNKKKREPIEREPQTKIDPHERAFTQLQLLEQQQLVEQKKHEEFQVKLTHIIREFLTAKYGISAMESTTSEILRQVDATSFPKHKEPTLRELLSMADLVKFARAEKAGDFHRRMLLEAKELIKITNSL